MRRGDWIVGDGNAAPPGREAWWVAARPLQFSHLQAVDDRRILADILRQLDGQSGWGRAGEPGRGTVPPDQGTAVSTSAD